MGCKTGVNPNSLQEAEWEVIFAHDTDPAIREALSELLEYRKEKATDCYYLEYTGAEGYRRNRHIQVVKTDDGCDFTVPEQQF